MFAQANSTQATTGRPVSPSRTALVPSFFTTALLTQKASNIGHSAGCTRLPATVCRMPHTYTGGVAKLTPVCVLPPSHQHTCVPRSWWGARALQRQRQEPDPSMLPDHASPGTALVLDVPVQYSPNHQPTHRGRFRKGYARNHPRRSKPPVIVGSSPACAHTNPDTPPTCRVTVGSSSRHCVRCCCIKRSRRSHSAAAAATVRAYNTWWAPGSMRSNTAISQEVTTLGTEIMAALMTAEGKWKCMITLANRIRITGCTR